MAVGIVVALIQTQDKIIEDHEGWEGVKKEICNYLLWGLVLSNERLVKFILTRGVLYHHILVPYNKRIDSYQNKQPMLKKTVIILPNLI